MALQSLLLFLLAIPAAYSQQTGNHTDWPRWCGKVYESGYSSFDPGGQTVEPPRDPNGPLLHIQLAPRYSLYLDSEAQGEFVVRTTLSQYFGRALPGHSHSPHAAAGDQGDLQFSITLDAEPGHVLARGTASLDFGGGVTTRDTIVPFDLASLETSLTAQNVTLAGWVVNADGASNVASVAARGDLLYLPEKASGSVARLDNAYGGFLFRSAATGHQFRPFFPYGFYASYDGFLANATDNTSAAAVVGAYAAFGLNAMTPLSQYPQSAAAFAYMEEHDLRIQFDLREGYTNLTWVADQVTAARDNAALFSYWSADEPDGHQDPFDAPVRARDTICGLDPYHPVAVVLNCADYYFGPYTAGADVIMEDVYPIGINSTWSKWGTACNATLGDCGCDDCRGGRHAVRDVADRLDALARYESWLPGGGRWPKTKIHNPQSFHGEGYWARDPTAAEEWAMALVAVNHGAQAIISWVYPVAAGGALPAAHGKLAQVLTRSPVVDFLVGGARPARIALPAGKAAPDVDVACWRRGDQLLLSVVNSGYDDYGAADNKNGTKAAAPPLSIALPEGVRPAPDRPYRSIEAVVWGDLAWSWSGDELSTRSIPALSTSIIILSAA